MKTIGIEMAHGAGDACFSIPLIEALCIKDNARAVIAVEKRCADIYNHVPCICDIVEIPYMHHGKDMIEKKTTIQNFYQITPHVYFSAYKDADCNHSLALTAMAIGKHYGVDINPRPKIYITQEETMAAKLFFDNLNHNNIVAIESEFLSGQSWTNNDDFEKMVKKSPEKLFLWLSLKEPAFNTSNLIYVGKSLTRRECIALLNHVQLFVNVGSGFFCASLSETIRPKESWILWNDDWYKYKETMSKTDWITNGIWFDNRNQWNTFLETI